MLFKIDPIAVEKRNAEKRNKTRNKLQQHAAYLAEETERETSGAVRSNRRSYFTATVQIPPTGKASVQYRDYRQKRIYPL